MPCFKDAQGKKRDAWEGLPIRITDIATSPDGSRFVAVGMSREYTVLDPNVLEKAEAYGLPHPPPKEVYQKRIMIWNWDEKRLEA